ncbi:MAG: hypothetical protein K2X62_02685 [Beijerinckiaceae bacterium]|nr:hypothetical protein [Beijerinckiaceae bacterium]
MIVSRRIFLGSLAAAFGASCLTDLRKRIEDVGRPILLQPPAPAQTLHIYEGGYLTFGSETLNEDVERPTWRDVLRVEGVEVDDPVTLSKVMRQRWMEPNELDAPVSDVCWPMVYESTWTPAARAVRYLERVDIGPQFRTRKGCAGRLNFHEGDNHPGSSERWVDVPDDLSASLLQARLIELGERTRVVMDVPTIWRDEE